MLQILACKKYYNGRQVLNIPSLELTPGVYWLEGINGSGKTTILRMIAGLIPFTGDIFFNGISLRKNQLDYRRNLSLAESEPLYPAFITGQELVRFYQHIRKSTHTQIKKLSDHFQLEQFLPLPIGSYSSGMIKKLSLMLAFIGNPPLILLDEPLATLDAETHHALPDLINEYRMDFGVSFIFSSHQPIKTGSLMIDQKLLVADQSIYLAR